MADRMKKEAYAAQQASMQAAQAAQQQQEQQQEQVAQTSSAPLASTVPSGTPSEDSSAIRSIARSTASTRGPRGSAVEERGSEDVSDGSPQGKPTDPSPNQKSSTELPSRRAGGAAGTPTEGNAEAAFPGINPQRTEQAARVATSGYAADMGPILAAMSSQMTDPQPYADQLKQIDALLPQAIEEYRRTGRNPLADIVLAGMKPKRNEDEEERLRQNAKLLALNNVLSLIGRGIAASGGVRPGPIDNKPIYDIQNRLQRLDDIYRQEGERYDQNRLLAALRKDQANAQAAQNTVAELQNRRQAYADLYADAVKNNREIAGKMADKALEASKYQTEVALRREDQAEQRRHNRASEGLQWQRLQKEMEDGTPVIIDRTTRQPVKLTREKRAMLDMMVGYLVDGRTRDTKSGGLSITSGGVNYSPGGYAGRKPKVLNNMLTDEQWIALDKYTKDGTMNPTASAAYSKIAGAYSKALNGDMSDFGVPNLPKRPKMTPTNPENKKEVDQVNKSVQKFLDEAAYTVRGQIEVAELLGGGIPTIEDIKRTNANMDTKLTDKEWETVYGEALDDFLMNKTDRDE